MRGESEGISNAFFLTHPSAFILFFKGTLTPALSQRERVKEKNHDRANVDFFGAV